MKSIIEELYYGNIDPQNSGFEDNESVQRELPENIGFSTFLKCACSSALFTA